MRLRHREPDCLPNSDHEFARAWLEDRVTEMAEMGAEFREGGEIQGDRVNFDFTDGWEMTRD